MSWRGMLRKAGASVTVRPDGIRDWNIDGKVSASNLPDYPRKTYYVDRNMDSSGDGSSFARAFKTINEAITQVNTDYTDDGGLLAGNGRNRRIIIGEGWYSEVTMTLTAHDVHVIGVGPGSAAGTVLYGSLTAGGWDDGNTGPALAITGWNNTIENISFVNRSATVSQGTYAGGVTAIEHPCILEGTYLIPVNYNKYINCTFMRDQPDCASWGIISYSSDHTLIDGCLFNGYSLRAGGVAFQSGTGTNHSADIVRNCYFFGPPVGIWQNSSHNTMIHNNVFTNQGANAITLTNACNIVGGTAHMMWNTALDITLANFNAGSGGVEMANLCSDTGEEDWPESTNA